MSAYLASSDTLSALVTYWSQRANLGASTALARLEHAWAMARYSQSGEWDYSQSRARVADLLETLATPERLAYLLLLQENQNSLEARYPGDSDYRSAEGYGFRRSGAVLRWVMSRQTGHLVGLLSGYEYQACEHDGWRHSVAFQICDQIRSYLLKDLEARDCGDAPNWASFTEPQDSPLVQLT
jgi:hypothetical protein